MIEAAIRMGMRGGHQGGALESFHAFHVRLDAGSCLSVPAGFHPAGDRGYHHLGVHPSATPFLSQIEESPRGPKLN